ncbi:hypothetical protein BH92_27860 (plasmid) [Rhodococcoides fascians A21d2]|uniref:hypothetical protein n=1 Tax=Rhodococcoides fascians TaxID=1828 RepID=UPI000AEC69A9|nr:hypothetical protein [Rhodococcus fascians]QII03871.1 hypothetical protein BH92_27860 [Rhodococcus fascians A21d2]
MITPRAALTALTDTATEHGWPETLRLAFLLTAVQLTPIMLAVTTVLTVSPYR